MPFRAHPDLAFGPLRKLPEFLHLRMAGGRIIGKRQSARIEEANLGAEVLQQPAGLFAG